MLKYLHSWKGPVEINGILYSSVSEIDSDAFSGDIHILLRPANKNGQESVLRGSKRITVKPYMTRKSTPEFDFMKKWNNDVPMPMITMIGHVVKETRGMVYMDLYADIYADKICSCMKCGRKITNPISQYFGLGPECGNHGYVNPFNNDAELRDAVEKYRKQLRNITWCGWIIKSAIVEEEELC